MSLPCVHPSLLQIVIRQKRCNTVLSAIGLVYALMFGTTPPTIAQVTVDDTLATTVTSNDMINFTIEGGDRTGNNLFHSFDAFSIPTNGSAVFNNVTDIETIISRVTGGQPSSIDGLLRTNGTADLFLINPSGISFGANAQLNLGGSLITSTATSLHFEDGTVFSATDSTPPLLTVSTPMGLQLGQNPGAIDISGSGKDGPFPSSNLGLEMPSSETVAFIGGDVRFNGGVVTAESGRIEVGSGFDGMVGLTPIPVGWAMDYSEVQTLGTITLEARSSLWNPNPSANRMGGIQVVGHDIQLEQSQIAAATFGDRMGGTITVNASGPLTLGGEDLTQFPYSSWIVTQVESEAMGDGGAIAITAEALSIQNGARIQTLSEGSGEAGAIWVTANTIDMQGFSPLSSNPFLALLNLNSRISSEITASGNAGSVDVRAAQIDLQDGGQIISLLQPSSTGNGQPITIGVEGAVTITGENPNAPLLLSGIGHQGFGEGKTGTINLQAADLMLDDGGLIVTLNAGIGEGSLITLDISEQIVARGSNVDGDISSGIISATSGLASGADIAVTTGSLTIDDGANLLTTAVLDFGNLLPLPTEGRIYQAGDIAIAATDFIRVRGGNAEQDRGLSIIASNTFIESNSGSIAITTPRLFVEDGAGVGTLVLLPLPDVVNTDAEAAIVGQGNGGDVVIDASSIRVSGMDVTGKIGSTLGNLTAGAGNAGNTTLNVQRLVVDNQGIVNSVTSASGDAGTLTINAAQSVTINQSGDGGIIANAIQIEDPFIQQLFSVPKRPSGNTGTLRISAPLLRLTDQGTIAVRHEGTGNAGQMVIQADVIKLENGSEITAETLLGEGGNIAIRANSILAAVVDSNISVESKGDGDGGNILIESPFVLGFRNSDIIANAFEGNGGNISIDTQGLFGLEFRPGLTVDSDITASSEFGVSGTVEISSPDIAPNSQTIELPQALVDVSQLVRPGCSLDQDQFVVAGRGGLPNSPLDLMNGDRPWVDTRNPLSQPHQAIGHANPIDRPETTPMQEATGMAFVEHSLRLIAPNGSLQLVTTSSPSAAIPYTSCTSQANIL